jgi:hypothetical protein
MILLPVVALSKVDKLAPIKVCALIVDAVVLPSTRAYVGIMTLLKASVMQYTLQPNIALGETLDLIFWVGRW